MHNRIALSLVVAVVLLAGGGQRANAQSQAVFVIAAPGTVLAPSEVKAVFLGDKTFAGSTRLVPIDNTALREAFLNKVLAMTAPKYESVWIKKSFRDAINPPRILSNDAEVVDFVKRTPGAVGYVATRPTGVTVIQEY